MAGYKFFISIYSFYFSQNHLSVQIQVYSSSADSVICLAKTMTCFNSQNRFRNGQIGDLLRREGLYSSHLTTWRRQRDEGLLDALSPKKRGRKKTPRNPLADTVARLEKDNRRLQQKLKQAELIIEAQKKCRRSWGSLKIWKKATRPNDCCG